MPPRVTFLKRPVNAESNQRALCDTDCPIKLAFRLASSGARNKGIIMHRAQRAFRQPVALLTILLLTGTHAEVLSPKSSFAPGFETTLTLRHDWAVAGTAHALILAPDGKFYLGGAFTSSQGPIRLNLARFNPEGRLDDTFKPDSVNGPVHALQLQPDGRLVIGGDFTMVGSVERGGIARFADDGSLDLSFNPGTGFDAIVRAVVLQPDGTLFVGGDFNAFDGNVRKRVAHLNPDGSVDQTFDPGTGPQTTVFSLAVQEDGKVVVGTVYSAYHGTTRDGIYRLNTNGTLDATFTPPTFGFGSFSEVRGLVVQQDGKIIAVGTFSGYGSEIRYGVARLNSDATLDASFNPATEWTFDAYAVQLLPDGKILVAGHGNENGQPGIVLLKPTGALDSIFNPGSGFGGIDVSPFAQGLGTDGGIVYDLAVQPDGRFLAAGSFGSYADTPVSGVVRLTSDGSLYFPFLQADLKKPGFVTSAAPMAGGRLLVGGLFQSVNGISRTNIAVLNSDGTVDTNVVPELIAQEDIEVTAVAAQPDGKLVVGYKQAGYTSGNLARLDSSGAVDVRYYPGPGLGSTLYAHFTSLVVQPDGKLLVNGALRYNPDASLDSTYQATSSGGTHLSANAVVLQPDGKVLVGGDFTSVNDLPRNRIARLNTNGMLDATFAPGSGFNAEVKAFALQDDGKIIVGGKFATFNGAGRNRIARLNLDGTLDTSFSVGSGFNNTVESLFLQADGKVVAAGPFTSFSGTPSSYFARLNADGSLDQSFTVPGVLLGTATPSANGPNLRFPELGKVFIPVLMGAGGGSILAGGSWLLFENQVGGGLVLLEPPPPVAIDTPGFSLGVINLNLMGAPGTTQIVQRATSPMGPWTNISMIVLEPDGSGQFEDMNPPAESGYYRTLQQ